MGFIKNVKEIEQDKYNKKLDLKKSETPKFNCHNLIKAASLKQLETEKIAKTSIISIPKANKITQYTNKYQDEIVNENRVNYTKKGNNTKAKTQIPADDFLSWKISTPMVTNVKDKIQPKSTGDNHSPSYLFKSYLTAGKDKDYKNIPLKDVPMNDLVVKLQKEFEQEEENIYPGLDNLWSK